LGFDAVDTVDDSGVGEAEPEMRCSWFSVELPALSSLKYSPKETSGILCLFGVQQDQDTVLEQRAQQAEASAIFRIAPI
jgi:hypothetical protein